MRHNGHPLPSTRPALGVGNGRQRQNNIPSGRMLPSHRRDVGDDENDYSFATAAQAATLARRTSHNKTRKIYGRAYMQARNNNSMPAFASMTNSQEYYGGSSNNHNPLNLLAGVCESPSSTTSMNNNDGLLTPRKRQSSNNNCSWPPSQRNKTSSTPDSQCCVQSDYVSKRRTQQSKNIGYGGTRYQMKTAGRGEPTTDDENASQKSGTTDEYHTDDEYEYDYDSTGQQTPKMVRDFHDENNERENSYRGMMMSSSDSPRTYPPPDCSGNTTSDSCRMRSGKIG